MDGNTFLPLFFTLDYILDGNNSDFVSFNPTRFSSLNFPYYDRDEYFHFSWPRILLWWIPLDELLPSLLFSDLLLHYGGSHRLWMQSKYVPSNLDVLGGVGG